MVSIDVFAFVLTGLGLAASILYYANMLANANKTRKAQLFLNIYNVTLDEAMNNKWYEAMTANLKDYQRNQAVPRTKDLHTLWQKYNGIGHLMMQGLLDVESAYHYSEGWRGALLWMKWGKVIKDSRKVGTNPDYMDGFEYMAGRIMEYRNEKGLPNELPLVFQT